MPLIEIVVGLALVQLVAFSMLVGRARGKYNIEAPATTGHEMFDRYFRVHMNTVEMIIVFIPAIYLFGKNISEPWGAGIGAVYLIGRILFLKGYVADPKKRGLGFGLSFIPTMILLLGGLGGAICQAIK